jgi:uncharacterized Zn-binding protein involved in type VI secretion
MADGSVAMQRLEMRRVKDLGDKPHTFVQAKGGAVTIAGGDAGAFLAAMLEGKEAVVSQQSCIFVAVNGKDAAFMFGTVRVGQWV